MSIPKGDCNDAVRTFLGTKVMNNKKISNAANRGLSLLEMVISLTIILIIFAAILPQFKNVQNSWASKQGAAEAVQNARVVMDFLNRHLAQAAKVTAVSDPADTTGYIEFKDNAGNTIRCELGANEYIKYSDVATGLFDLAGPASKLQFTCYTLNNFDTPTTDADYIRLVKVEATLTNTAQFGQDKTFMTEAYLRSNTLERIAKAVPFEYDPLEGHTPAIAQIDSTHFLCAYTGYNDHGWALVLTVDLDEWTLTKGPAIEFDELCGKTPVLEKIDATRYLCAYDGPANKGTARVLIVDPFDWTVSRGPSFVYKINHGMYPALTTIDSTHCLCVYAGASNDGWAVVLNINPSDWSITKNVDLEYDTTMGLYPDVEKINSTHYLCTYTGPDNDGWASVLKVKTSDWTITEESTFEFDSVQGITPALAKIDAGHYLCAYSGPGDDGYAVILGVDNGTWAISKGPKLEYDPAGYTVGHDLAQISTYDYLCVYTGHTDAFADDGWSVVLNVNLGDWTVNGGDPFEFDPVHGERPALAKIDQTHFLCVYDGPANDGWAVVLRADLLLRP